MAQMREDLRHVEARFTLRRQGRDVHVGVVGDQPDKLCARVAGRAEDGDIVGHWRLRKFELWDV